MTGAWLVDSNLWHFSKRWLVISLPSAAVIGLLLSIFVASANYIYVYPCIYIAFLLTAGILILGRTQIYPCFGAAILPILFQTTSWIYPISVLCMALVLCAGRTLLEHLGARARLPKSEFSDLPEHRRERVVYYFQTSLGILPALILVLAIGDHFMLLPPMFVTYATFCNHRSAFIGHAKQTWFQLCMATLTGSLLSLAASSAFNTKLDETVSQLIFALAAALSVLITIFIGKRCKPDLFPPAMSLALTPFLIKFYPWLLLYAPCMTAYFIIIAIVMQSHPAYKNQDLKYM